MPNCHRCGAEQGEPSSIHITSSHSEEISFIRKENQNLHSSLGLKEIEKEDLKAQIRALESQLNEKETTSARHLIQPLKEKLNLVGEKLGSWEKLIEGRLEK